MEIKNEGNVFKVELASHLKQLSEKIVIGKNSETNSTNIQLEDNSKHLTINLNFLVSPNPEQIEDITRRVKNILLEQSEVVAASGDSTFAPHAAKKLPISPVLAGTAEALVIENRDYLIEGKGKPTFITNFKNLPVSVFVAPSPTGTSNR